METMKQLLKKIFLVIAIIIDSPLILLALIGKKIFKSDGLFAFGSQCLALVPGLVGTILRTAYYYLTMDEFHPSCYLLFGTIFPDSHCRIRKYSKFGEYSIIGLCDLGERVTLSSKVSVLAGRYQHNFTDLNKDVFDGEPVYQRVRIGDGTFVGEGTIIMADIGEYCIIGAGSVVVKEIPPYSVAVGNPARVIKDRRQELQKNQ